MKWCVSLKKTWNVVIFQNVLLKMLWAFKLENTILNWLFQHQILGIFGANVENVENKVEKLFDILDKIPRISRNFRCRKCLKLFDIFDKLFRGQMSTHVYLPILSDEDNSLNLNSTVYLYHLRAMLVPCLIVYHLNIVNKMCAPFCITSTLYNLTVP